jgi:hypothetical protein
MRAKATVPIGSEGRSTGAAIRTIGPAVPLAVALLGGALSSPTAPSVAGPGAAAARQSVGHVAPVNCGASATQACTAPYPLLAKGHPVNWWFVFKLNAGKFPQCGNGDTRACPFGGTPQTSASYKNFSQRFVYASSEAEMLQDGGSACLGDTTDDPVGASFDEVYNGNFHYVVWNDQPYGDPAGECSGNGCDAPWGHSKGMVAWNEAGEGFVMQVSTPSWPLAASSQFPRKSDGNTLGCVRDNDVEVSQHFFAMHLNKADLVLLLQGLNNASVVTDPKNQQVVNNGGPADVQELVASLGKVSANTTVVTGMFSSGVELIAKPSKLAVPPWQLVSAELGGAPLRTANWWTNPDALPSTTADTPMGCWDPSLGKPGPVEIATTGHWKGTEFGLKGGDNPEGNHGKIGVSTGGGSYAIFGDMNQEGSIGGVKCTASQNGRGGMFFVVNNATLATSVGELIAGDTVPVK